MLSMFKQLKKLLYLGTYLKLLYYYFIILLIDPFSNITQWENILLTFIVGKFYTFKCAITLKLKNQIVAYNSFVRFHIEYKFKNNEYLNIILPWLGYLIHFKLINS